MVGLVMKHVLGVFMVINSKTFKNNKDYFNWCKDNKEVYKITSLKLEDNKILIKFRKKVKRKYDKKAKINL